MNPLYRRLCLCAVVIALGPVSAEPQQGRAAPVRPDSPPAEQGRQRNEEGRPAQQQEGTRRPSKLSPEERKELRQQIHEAGHDIYHQKRHQER